MIRPRNRVSLMAWAIWAEHAAGDPAVALGAPVAERGVGLVDHDGDGVHRAQEREDLLEVPLGHALPLRAEVLELDHRDPDLARKGRDQERLAGPDRARDEVPHRHHVRPSGLDGLGGGAEVGLGLVVPGHEVERVVGLDELEEPVRLGLDELLLLVRQRLEREPALVLEHVGEDRAELDVPEPGRVLRQREVGDVRERVEPGAPVAGRFQKPPGERLALVEVGEVDLELGVVRALDKGAREVVEVLGDQDEGKIGPEEERVVGPLLERHEGRPVLGRVRRRLRHRDDRLGVVDDEGDPLPVRQPEAEVVVEEGKNAGRVLRELFGVLRPEDRVVPCSAPG